MPTAARASATARSCQQQQVEPRRRGGAGHDLVHGLHGGDADVRIRVPRPPRAGRARGPPRLARPLARRGSSTSTRTGAPRGTSSGGREGTAPPWPPPPTPAALRCGSRRRRSARPAPPGSLNVIRLPIGSSPGQWRSAMKALTMTTRERPGRREGRSRGRGRGAGPSSRSSRGGRCGSRRWASRRAAGGLALDVERLAQVSPARGRWLMALAEVDPRQRADAAQASA